MEIPVPTPKTLPFYVIFALAAAVSGLSGYIIQREAQCASERAEWEKKQSSLIQAIADCETQSHEADHKLSAFLIRQDSVYKAHIFEIQKIRKK